MHIDDATRRRMAQTLAACVFAAAMLLLHASAGASETSSTVELIMKKVQDEESWIDTVNTFYLKYDVKWINSPETLEERTKAWKKRYPQEEPDPKKYWDLRPEQDQTEVWAFDKTRIAVSKSAPETLLDHRYWDGKEGVIHEQYIPLEQEQYTLFSESAPTVGRAVIPFYFQAFFHDFWWVPMSAAQKKRNLDWEYPSLKDFQLLGEDTVDGKKCWKISFQRHNQLYWVDKESGHLVKMVRMIFAPPADKREEIGKKVKETWLQSLAKQGHEFKSLEDATLWMKKLPSSEQKKYTDAMLLASREIVQPFLAMESQDDFRDYREVAPGCWYPMAGELTIYSTSSEDKRYVSVHQKTKVLDIQVDKPLPEDLFHVAFKEGVQTYDYRYNPPLEYKYKKDRTEKEWEELKQAAKDRAAKSEKE